LSFDENEVPSSSETESQRPSPRAFTREQMVTCDVCLRANPPTRTSCLYCAAQLPTTAANTALQRPTLRKLEKWEQGFNALLLPGNLQPLTGTGLGEMAQLLRLEPEDLKRIIEAGVPLPLAHAATLAEASFIERQLAAAGVSMMTVADGELLPEAYAPKRARALEINEDELVIYLAGGNGTERVAWSEILLLVAGRLFARRIEVEERKGRKAEKEIVDAREMSADDPVLDVYSTRNDAAWRIVASGFDFSCLGAQKGLVSGQNFSTLTGILRGRASGALFSDSYLRVRHALAPVWPLEEHTESGGRRRRTGRINTEAVTKSDNEMQFTRYSRLQYYLRLHHPELSA